MLLFRLVRQAAFVCALVMLFSVSAPAGHHKEEPAKTAIVLAAFGTSYPDALQSILNIKSRVQNAHPDTPVRLAFTSSIIRKKWRNRQTDTEWLRDNPDVPKEVLFVKSPLATIADLQNDGYKSIAVQSLHIFAGEEFEDLKSTVTGLRSIRTVKARSMPFKALRLGRPALGMPGDAYPYTDDITAAAKTLEADVLEAKEADAALVYMGHGNDYFPTSAYAEMQRKMQTMYNYPVYIACVEGFPDFNDLLNGLATSGKPSIILKPFMVVAGDHASNDMAGDEDDAWKVLLTKEGYAVKTVLRGLGKIDAWADIYVRHLNDAMSQTHMLQ